MNVSIDFPNATALRYDLKTAAQVHSIILHNFCSYVSAWIRLFSLGSTICQQSSWLFYLKTESSGSAPHIIFNRIAVRRVWRPHIGGNQKKYLRATSEFFWSCYCLPVTWLHSSERFGTHFGSLPNLQRYVDV